MADTDVVVTREIDLDLAPDRLWDLVADGAGWAGWLAADADVDVVEGGGGRLVDDDGKLRRVRIDDVDRTSGVRFAWWPEEAPDLVSTVELVVVPRSGGSRLLVREVWAQAGPDRAGLERAVTSLRAWDIRALVLWSRAAAPLQAV